MIENMPSVIDTRPTALETGVSLSDNIIGIPFRYLLKGYVNSTGFKYLFCLWTVQGGLTAAFSKIEQIMVEPKIKYKYPIVEAPLDFTYHSLRVFNHFMLGAYIGGFFALTAPISAPLYALFLYYQKNKKNGDSPKDAE